MAEPASASTIAIAAAASALIVELLGVEPQTLAWSMVGAIFGSSLAPPAGRFRQVLVFGGVVLASSLLGSVIAEALGHSSMRWRNVWCFIFGGLFHVIAATVVTEVPGIVRSLLQIILTRRGGVPADPPPAPPAASPPPPPAVGG